MTGVAGTVAVERLSPVDGSATRLLELDPDARPLGFSAVGPTGILYLSTAAPGVLAVQTDAVVARDICYGGYCNGRCDRATRLFR